MLHLAFVCGRRCIEVMVASFATQCGAACPTDTSWQFAATWPGTSRQIETRPVTGHDEEHVARWMSVRARPRGDGRATLEELHGDYQRWCERYGLAGCDVAAFASAF